MPLLILAQNIYTDPQRPMQMDQGIYPIGEPGPDSPLLITTNFSLTYFTVAGEIEASKVPTWLLVMDTEGQSVLTSWAAGKFVADAIATFVKKSGIEEKVNHRTHRHPRLRRADQRRAGGGAVRLGGHGGRARGRRRTEVPARLQVQA